MLRSFVALLVCGALAGCGGVGEKVLVDFGIKDAPEGYFMGSERVEQRLEQIGPAEIRRLNSAARRGEVKYQDDDLRGRYYKEVKVYENAYPLDARAAPNRSRAAERGYYGFIEYTYRVYQSRRVKTKAEARAQSADIPTNETGRETYRYRFDAGGDWNGEPGTLSRN